MPHLGMLHLFHACLSPVCYTVVCMFAPVANLYGSPLLGKMGWRGTSPCHFSYCNTSRRSAGLVPAAFVFHALVTSQVNIGRTVSVHSSRVPDMLI